MLTEMARAARGSVLTLTHFGRKSGKPYKTKLWFAEVEGDLWIGSLANDRAWVRNARATGRAALDFGGGPRDVELEYCGGRPEIERYRAAINRKHWLLGPLLQRLVKGSECCFRVRPLRPAADAPGAAAPAQPAPTTRQPTPAVPVAR